MNSFRIISLAAFSMLAFAACQQAEITGDEPELAHSLSFVTETLDSKTGVTIDGSTATFAWTADDANRFTVYENGTAATTTKGTLADGVMSITAEFAGAAGEGANSYVAVLNSSNSTQIMNSASYDEEADILVSEPVSAFANAEGVLLRFKREVAIAKMTLKGLDAGEVVSLVTISSTAELAGKYGVKGWSEAVSSIELSSAYAMGEESGYSIVADASGNAVVWFTCIPQDAATLTVKVEAADGDTYTKEFAKPITLTRGDVKGFGVGLVKDEKVKPWVAIDLADIDETMPVVITMAKEGTVYALSLTGTDGNALGTTKAPKALTVTVTDDGKLSKEPSSDILWNIANNGGNLTIYPDRVTSKWLYTTAGNDGVRLGTTTIGSVWSIDVKSGYLKASDSKNETRYLGVYTTTPDWRAYTNTTGNTAGQTLRFYSNASTKTALEAPKNLKVSEAKVVSWDAVAGAASYVLTIGSAKIPCETNSYNASEIADEYYDVAVVAVPSDTDNYKNSDAATLTNAKFGTPKLNAPTLKKGAIDESSVNTTWTVDSRATAGYNCELYNGETKVGDSKIVSTGSVTFDGLNGGVTYTVKINAIAAVEGVKAYAASDVATIDLTTKGTVTLSEITEEGTYTVKDVTVYAVINASTTVIGDGTAYFYMYKSGHGLAVGNTFTIGGTVSVYNNVLQFNDPTISNKTTGSTPAYANPVEANEEYLTSYASAPVTEYIHAKGTQSGRSISIGSQVLYLSAENAETDGKDVEVYGFVYGYSTKHSNTYFYATSIAEDPTAPKLSVTPTSKTWESTKIDAAVFKVTTNTQGKNDWSVSPTTLEWATIVVDKTAGTITVTPTSANEAKTAREATLTVTHAADASIYTEIKLKQNGSEVVLTDDTINIAYTDIPSGYDSFGTSGTFEVTTTQNATITVGYGGLNTKSSNGTAYSYTMFVKNQGYMYSNTALDGYYVKSVTATFSSGTGTTGKAGITLTSTVSSSRNSNVSGLVSKNGNIKVTNEDTNLKYWNLSTTEANVQIVSVVVVYAPVN